MLLASAVRQDLPELAEGSKAPAESRPVPPPEVQTLPRGGVEPLGKQRIRDLLSEARERTLWLVEPVDEADMDRVHDPLMSPLVWDLGHIAAFEDLWLAQRAGGLEPLRDDLSQIYDAAETPRAVRRDVPYLRTHEAREFMVAVRERSLEVLECVDVSPDGDRLNANGFVWDMLIQHEQQHSETMLQTLQLAEPGVYAPARRGAPPSKASRPEPEMVPVRGGPFLMGTGPEGFAYDNERPQHEVDLADFHIDTMPVSCAAYREFIADGGYRRRECWSAEGWAWREREGIERPLYWTADGAVRSFEREQPLDPALAVTNVSWFEADAYARWRGKRLPTEAEWERAASWDPLEEAKRRFPWGDEPPSAARANLDQTAFGVQPAGARPAGASAEGVLGLIGDVWEWTASELDAYPGFRTFPYPQYSEAFLARGYRVLRGGSWATRPRVVRSTFRNWDLPERRQIFSGFRCAVDA